MRRFIVVTAAALIALTGCASGGSSNSSGASSSSGRAGDAAAAGAPKSVSGGAAAGAEPVRLAPQAIIYTADLSMRAGDVPGAEAEAKRIVTAAGGYVGGESATDATGTLPSATITFKIPSARYQGTLDQLASSRIGWRVSLHQQADDVTQEVADVASRVKSAQATLASFRKLQDRAQSIDDIVRLEQEISSRESDLESLQARQKSLSAQTTYATVTLRLDGTAVVRHEHRKAGGFTGGVTSGWHAFTAFLGGLALVFGWLLPFLGLAALLGLPALWIWRRRRSTATGAS
jgi:Domain of unknown function (DUF4349)